MVPNKKPLIILIHGAKTKHPFFIKSWAKKYYDHFGINTENGGSNWLEPVKKFFEESTNCEVIIFRWSGGISRVAVYRAAVSLAKALEKKTEYENIKLFCKSLGGNVADLAVNRLKNNANISKIIYVATPHQPSTVRIPSHIKQINVYSNDDTYIDFANRVLYLGLGKKRLDRAENIELLNLKHSDYFSNQKITWRNETMGTLELFRRLLQ